MSVRAVTMYVAACDWPGCDITGDTLWRAASEVYIGEEDWVLWREGRDGSHYCAGHPTTWASDHESGEPYPGTPYLLIHDEDGRDDAGKVAYVGGVSTLTARFTSGCPACEGPIDPGDLIRWDDGQVVHAECQSPGTDEATSPRCWLTHGGECDR